MGETKLYEQRVQDISTAYATSEICVHSMLGVIIPTLMNRILSKQRLEESSTKLGDNLGSSRVAPIFYFFYSLFLFIYLFIIIIIIIFFFAFFTDCNHLARTLRPIAFLLPHLSA